MARAPRTDLVAAIVAAQNNPGAFDVARAAYAQRCAADMAEATARRWWGLGMHYPTPGSPGIPHGYEPPDGAAVPHKAGEGPPQVPTFRALPDYGMGEAGGYQRTTPGNLP